RHALDAAGSSRLATHRILPHGQTRRGGGHGGDIHQPEGEAHAGLHHRAVWLMVRFPLPFGRSRAQGETMNEHTVKSYEEELALLDKKIAQMGGLAEQLLGKSLEALERRDPKVAEEVVLSDRMIDNLEREIEEQVISMIARRQPMADDLRHIMGALRITTDL